jgi:hypothetical protein
MCLLNHPASRGQEFNVSRAASEGGQGLQVERCQQEIFLVKDTGCHRTFHSTRYSTRGAPWSVSTRIPATDWTSMNPSTLVRLMNEGIEGAFALCATTWRSWRDANWTGAGLAPPLCRDRCCIVCIVAVDPLHSSYRAPEDAANNDLLHFGFSHLG